MLGEEVDSAQVEAMKSMLPQYGLEGVKLDIVQNTPGVDIESVRGMIFTERNKTLATQRQLAENEREIRLLRDSMEVYGHSLTLSRVLLPELTALFPDVHSVSTGRGVHTYWADSVMRDSVVYVVNVVLTDGMKPEEQQRMDAWLRMRLGRDDVQVVVSRDGVVRETAKK